ncbi:RagB/SusD family nutrient uptake outer membrane protein, partial [Phocaeicola vulgatus]
MISNKIYKKILTVALGTALFSLPLFTACESDVVDLQPIDKFSDLTAYSTPDRCELSVIGAYDAAQCGLYINTGNGRTRGYPFGAASILQGEMRGEDMNLTAVFYDYTYSATYNVSTANNVAMWETSFEAINRYNIVRDGIEGAVANGIISQELGNQYKGELLFLRALTYHNLMIHFALPYN